MKLTVRLQFYIIQIVKSDAQNLFWYALNRLPSCTLRC